MVMVHELQDEQLKDGANSDCQVIFSLYGSSQVLSSQKCVPVFLLEVLLFFVFFIWIN